jgi:hypothetical protein
MLILTAQALIPQRGMKYPKGIRPDFSSVQAVSGINFSDSIKKKNRFLLSLPSPKMLTL